MSAEAHIQHLDNLLQFFDSPLKDLATEIQHGLSFDEQFNILLAPSALPTLKKLIAIENPDVQKETLFLLAALSANNNSELLETIEWENIKKFFQVDRIGSCALLGNLVLFDKHGDLVWKNGGIDEIVKCFPSLKEEENFDEEQKCYADNLKVEVVIALGNIALMGGSHEVYDKMGSDLILRLLKDENNLTLVSEVISLIQNLTFSNDSELKKKLIQHEIFIALIKISSEFLTKANDPENERMLEDYHNNYTVPQRAACFAIANLIPYYENSGTGVETITEQLAIFDWMMELAQNALIEGHEEDDNYTHFVMLPVAMAFNNLVHNKVLRSKILEGPQETPTNNHIDFIRQTLTKLIQKYKNRKSSSDPLQLQSEQEIVREASEALSVLDSETSKPQTEKGTSTPSTATERKEPTETKRMGKSASKSNKNRQTALVIARRESTQAAKHKKDTSRTQENVVKTKERTQSKKKISNVSKKTKPSSERHTEKHESGHKEVSDSSKSSLSSKLTEKPKSKGKESKKTTNDQHKINVDSEKTDKEKKNESKLTSVERNSETKSSTIETDTKSTSQTQKKTTETTINTVSKTDTPSQYSNDMKTSSSSTPSSNTNTDTSSMKTEPTNLKIAGGNNQQKTITTNEGSLSSEKPTTTTTQSTETSTPKQPTTIQSTETTQSTKQPTTIQSETSTPKQPTTIQSTETTQSTKQPTTTQPTKSTMSSKPLGFTPSAPSSQTRSTQPSTPISSSTSIAASSKIPRPLNKPLLTSPTKGGTTTGTTKKLESSPHSNVAK